MTTNNGAQANEATKKFLLVSLKEFNEDLIQKVLKFALEENSVAYSYKGSNTAFVFDKSMNSLEKLEAKLKNLPVETSTIDYAIESRN